MRSLPAVPESFEAHFEQMWRSACRVVDNIRDYEPDLVLALMHSGWGPVYAARVLWEQTQGAPFPPVAQSNIGREKIGIFETAFNMTTTPFFTGNFASDLEIGKLLAWLTSRGDWRVQLLNQAAQARQTAAPPERILVVDDCIREGSTSILALGLLYWVFPEAQVRFLNADSWYRTIYTDFLTEVILPFARLFPEGKILSEKVRGQLGQIAVGSENVSVDSLAWKPISINSPAVQALSQSQPAAEWLEASQAIYAVIAREITRNAPTYIPRSPDVQDFNHGLRTSACIMRDAWLEKGTTRREIQERYGLSSGEVSGLVEKWMEWDEITLAGRGPGTRYVIPPLLRRYIEKMEEATPDLLDAYWLVPGKLIFGDPTLYFENAADQEWERQEIREMLAYGVDCWLDVQFVSPGEAARENPLFAEEARAAGRAVIHEVVALEIQYSGKEIYPETRRGRPNRRDIRPVLDKIDGFLAGGRVVYVSAANSALRGVLAGCFLARHGQGGAEALAALQLRRAESAKGWRREPVSRRARRFIRRWPAGL